MIIRRDLAEVDKTKVQHIVGIYQRFGAGHQNACDRIPLLKPVNWEIARRVNVLIVERKLLLFIDRHRNVRRLDAKGQMLL